MKKPEPTTSEQLWKNVAPQLEGGVEAIIASRQTKEKRRDLIMGMLRIVYIGGVERGYDLGYHVFGDGQEDE